MTHDNFDGLTLETDAEASARIAGVEVRGEGEGADAEASGEIPAVDPAFEAATIASVAEATDPTPDLVAELQIAELNSELGVGNPNESLDDDGLPEAVQSLSDDQKTALEQIFDSYASTGINSSFEQASKSLSDLEIMNSVKDRLATEVDELNKFEYGVPQSSQAYSKLLERVKLMRKTFPGFSLGKTLDRNDGKDITGSVTL